MKIGIMSDSHDHRANIKKAIGIFKSNEVEAIIHAGDLISPFCLPFFEEFKGKFYLCAGNNVGDINIIPNKMKDLGYYYDEIGKFELDGQKFALYHGTDSITLDSLIYSKERFDYVITGHTHKKMLRKVEKTIIINPGETFDLYEYPTVAILNTETRKVNFVSLS